MAKWFLRPSPSDDYRQVRRKLHTSGIVLGLTMVVVMAALSAIMRDWKGGDAGSTVFLASVLMLLSMVLVKLDYLVEASRRPKNDDAHRD